MTRAVTQKEHTGHALKPEQGWLAEGKGGAEIPLYTFPTGSVEVSWTCSDVPEIGSERMDSGPLAG